MSKDNATIERWAYAGRRLDAKNSLRYLWYPLNAVGEVNRDVNYLFGKTPAHAIGSVYEVLVEHSEADGVTIYGKPSYTGDRIAEEKAWMRDLVLQWQTDTKAATTAAAVAGEEERRQRAERSAPADQAGLPEDQPLSAYGAAGLPHQGDHSCRITQN